MNNKTKKIKKSFVYQHALFVMLFFAFNLFFSWQKVHAGNTSDGTPPSDPVISATAVSNSEIDLSWPASTDPNDASNTISYDVYYCQGVGCNPTSGAFAGSTLGITTFANTGLLAGVTYGYAVDAYDPSGSNSNYSTTVYATTTGTPDTTPPSVPTGLAGTAVSSSQINLTWNASTDNTAVAGYKIYKNGTQIGTSTSLSYSNTGLTAGTAYAYTVAAYDAYGNTSAQSTSINVTTQAPDTTPPSVPTGLAGTAVSTSQINLTWNASTDNVGVTGYKIYKGGVYFSSTSSTSYSVAGLSAGTAYAFTVAAYDAAGNNSLQSTSINVTTQAPDTTAPSTPTGLTGTAVSFSQINLSWTASTDNVGVTGYNVKRNGVLIGTTTTTTYSDSGLVGSTNYSYIISAYDAAGNTSGGAGIGVTTLAPPVATATYDSAIKSFTGNASPTYGNINWLQGFSGNGTWSGTAMSGVTLNKPVGIAIDGNNNIFVADSSGNSVWKYDASQGIWSSLAPVIDGWSVPFSNPVSVVADASNNLYVSNQGSANIFKFDGNKWSVISLGNPYSSSKMGTFSSPSGMAIDANGILYVGDDVADNVQKYDTKNGTWSFYQNNGTYTVNSIAIDKTGNIYITGRYSTLVQIRKITPGGTSTNLSGFSGSMYNYLAVDNFGNLFNSDSSNNVIQQWNSGTSWTSIVTSGISGNNSIAFDQSGNLYVADGTNHRIQKFTPGTSITMRVRSGQTADGSGTSWIAWSNTCNVTNGQSLSTDSCVHNGDPFVQYEAVMATNTGTNVPTLGNVTISTQSTYPTTLVGQYLISSPFNTNQQYNNLSSITWNASRPDAASTNGQVGFQFRTSTDGSTWGAWCGPTTCGTANNATSFASDFYQTSGANIQGAYATSNNNKYFQYAAFLKANNVTDPSTTIPTITNVTVGYSYNVPPAISAVSQQQQTSGSYIGSVNVPYTLSETYDGQGNLAHGKSGSPIGVGLFYQPNLDTNSTNAITLATALDSGTTNGVGTKFTLNNAGNAPIPSKGTMLLDDNELISFDSTGTTGNQRNIVARGASFTDKSGTSYPTTAKAHAANVAVFFQATRQTDGTALMQRVDTLAATGTVGSQATINNTFNWDAKNDPYLNLNNNKIAGIVYKVMANDADSLGFNTMGVASATAGTLDYSAPTIASATTTTAAGQYKAGSTIPLLVTFATGKNISFDATGGKTIALNLTSGTCTISTSITASNTATCTYNVGSNDNTAAGQYLKVSSITTTGTIKDQFANQQTDFTIPAAQNVDQNNTKQIVIDSKAPQITNVAPAMNLATNKDTTSTSSPIAFTTTEQNAPLAGTSAIVFTRTGGAADATTHTCTLKGNALNAGTFSNFQMIQGANNCNETQTKLVDGATYTMAITANDQAGNQTIVSQTGITYDVTAPSKPTVSGPSFANTRPTISWTQATDTGSGLASYQLQRATSANGTYANVGAAITDSATLSSSSPSAQDTTLTTDGSTDGTYYYKVIATDKAGNTVTSDASGSVLIDTAAPIIAGKPNISAYTNNTKPTITWTKSTDSGSGVASYKLQRKSVSNPSWTDVATISDTASLAVDSNPVSYTETNALTEDTYYYQVFATDKSGNTNTASPSSDAMMVDVTAPSKVVVTGPQATKNQPTITWTQSTDFGSGLVSYQLQRATSANGTYANVGAAITDNTTLGNANPTFQDNTLATDGSADGTYYYKVIATDKAGNSTTSDASNGITLDTKAPTGTFAINNNSATPKYTNSRNITLNANILDTNGSGVNQMSFSDDNTTWSTMEAYANVKNWTLPAGDGEKTVYAKFSDNAGNVYTVSDKIFLDTTAPVAAITQPQINSRINTGIIKFTLSEVLSEGHIIFAGPEGNHQIDLSGADLTTINSEQTKTITGLVSDNTYSVNITGKDLAGNDMADDQINGIVYDVTKPVLSIKAPDNNSFINNVTDASDLSYNINNVNENSNALSQATLTFSDGTNTQTCTLKSEYLANGDHNNVDLSKACNENITLVTGTSYTFDIQGTDLAGNVSDKNEKTNVNFDTQAPVLNSFSTTNAQRFITDPDPNGPYGTGAVINITANFNEPIVSGSTMTVVLENSTNPETEVLLDTVNGNSISGSFTVDGPRKGFDTINQTIRSIKNISIADRAGNMQAAVDMPQDKTLGKNIAIDTGTPILQSFSATGGFYKAGTPITIIANYSKAIISGSSISLKLNTQSTQDQPITLNTVSQNKISGTYTPASDIDNIENLKVTEITAQNVSDFKNPPNTLTSTGTLDNYNAIFAAYNPPIDPVVNLNDGIRVDTQAPNNGQVVIDNGVVITKNKVLSVKVATQDNFADLAGMKIQLSNDGTHWCDVNGTANQKSDYTTDAINWDILATSANGVCGNLPAADAQDNVNATVYVQFFDGAGNSEVANSSIIFDGVPPKITSFDAQFDSTKVYGPGSQIPMTLTYNKPLMTQTNKPADQTLQPSIATATFNNGASVDFEQSPNQDNILVGTYTVGETGSSQDTQNLAINSIAQAVYDIAGNEQTGTSITTGTDNVSKKGIIIDTTAPLGTVMLDRSKDANNIQLDVKPVDLNGLDGINMQVQVLDVDMNNQNPACDFASNTVNQAVDSSKADTIFALPDTKDAQDNPVLAKKVCIKFTDKAGNTTRSGNETTEITPETPQSVAYTDISNKNINFYGSFLTWKAIDKNLVDENGKLIGAIEGTGDLSNYDFVFCESTDSSKNCVPDPNSSDHNFPRYKYDNNFTLPVSNITISPTSNYCYSVRAKDNSGDYSQFSPAICAIPGQAAQLANAQIDVRNAGGDINVTDITKSTATVNFKTYDSSRKGIPLPTHAYVEVYKAYKADANGVVSFDDNDKVGTLFTDSSATSSFYSPSHTIKMTGLPSNTQLYLKITAFDSQDDPTNPTRAKSISYSPTVNSNLTFTTLGQLSKIMNISDPPTVLSDKDAVLDFNTDQNANCYAEYGTNSVANPVQASPVTSTTVNPMCTAQPSGAACTQGSSNGTCDGNGNCVVSTPAPAASTVYNEVPVKEVDGQYSTNHSIHLASLLPQTVYYYKLTCTDGAKDAPSIISSNEGKFRTLDQQMTQADFQGRLDGTPPTISNISMPTITGESATVTWNTNEPANSLVAYELQGTDFMLMAGDYTVNADHTKYSTTHTVNIAGLLPASQYIYTVISADASGNIGQSTQSSFTTKQPSSLSSIKVVSTALGQATITWTTGASASSIVQYGLTTAYGQSKQDSTQTTNHSMILDGLTPGQTYHFQVRGEDSQKNIFASSDITFQPQAPPKIDNFKIDSISEHGATVTFTTNVPTSTLVTYANVDNPDDNGAQGKSDMLANHSIELKNLTSGANFSIKVKVNDENGNETEEDFPNFTTTKDTTPPVIDRVKTDSALTQDSKVQAIISWSTDELATGQIVYKEGKNGDEKTFDVNTTPSFSHVGVITTFKPGTVYYFNVKSTDVSGNVTKSSDYALLTPKQSQNIIQVIIGNFTDIFGWAKFGN